MKVQKHKLLILVTIYFLTSCSLTHNIYPDREAFEAIEFTPEYTIGVRFVQYYVFRDNDTIRLGTARSIWTEPKPNVRNARSYMIPSLVSKLEKQLNVSAIDVTEENNLHGYSLGIESRESPYRSIRKKFSDVDAVLDVKIIVYGEYSANTGDALGTLKMRAHLFSVKNHNHLLWTWPWPSNTLYHVRKGNFPFDPGDYNVAKDFNTLFDDARDKSIGMTDRIVGALKGAKA